MLIDNREDGLAVDAVMADSEPAAYALTEHLTHAHDARRLVCLAGPMLWPNTVEHVAGRRLAARRAELRPMVIQASETTIRDGAPAVSRLLDEN